MLLTMQNKVQGANPSSRQHHAHLPITYENPPIPNRSMRKPESAADKCMHLEHQRGTLGLLVTTIRTSAPIL